MTTTHSVADNALIDKLQWRYATKKMNPAKVVPQDKGGPHCRSRAPGAHIQRPAAV